MKEKEIRGAVCLLNCSNIDTDQIIPAKHLTGVSMGGLGPHLFEDLNLPGFDREDSQFKEATVLVTRENFGCGSSREHAVWALEANGFEVVIAPSFARIFRQNMFNRGLLALELLPEKVEKIIKEKWEHCEVSVSEECTICFWSEGKEEGITYSFQLSDFDKTLFLQGGLVGFVAERY